MMVACDVISEVINLFLMLANQIMEGRLVSAVEAVNKVLLIISRHLFLPLLDDLSLEWFTKDRYYLGVLSFKIQDII